MAKEKVTLIKKRAKSKSVKNSTDGIISIDLTAGYTGYIYDEVSGWWNAGQRTYAPEIKRFTSADPVSGNLYEPGRIVKYTYAGNAPVVNVDRDGRGFTSFCQTACTYMSKVWYAYNNLMEKIPAPVKIAVGTAGAAAGVKDMCLWARQAVMFMVRVVERQNYSYQMNIIRV